MAAAVVAVFSLFIIPIVLLIAGYVLDILFICSEYKGKMLRATILKGLASLMFVLIGAVYFRIGVKTPVSTDILVGLILGMVGDVLLNLRYLVPEESSNKVFAGGIAAFLAGHFLYIIAIIRYAAEYDTAGKTLLIALIATAVISAVSIPTLMKFVTPPSRGLQLFGYVYLTVVIAMFCFAATNMFVAGANAFTIVFAIGAFFFVVSDFILIYFTFGKKVKPLRAINLLMYYQGQILISICVLLAKLALTDW